jgi:molecular chaperone GrpE
VSDPETPATTDDDVEVPATDTPAGADLGPAAPTWVPDLTEDATSEDADAAADDEVTTADAAPTADADALVDEVGEPPHTALAEPEDLRSPEELRVELAEAEARRDEYLDDLRRARAEFENFRRRTAREAGAAKAAGRGEVVTGLLDVLDDLDRTLEAADGSSDETLAKGVSLVADKLLVTLQTMGVTRIDEPGVPFDPTVHEAVQHVPAEEPTDEQLVERTLRPGYKLGDRVLRPAMVVVTG